VVVGGKDNWRVSNVHEPSLRRQTSICTDLELVGGLHHVSAPGFELGEQCVKSWVADGPIATSWDFRELITGYPHEFRIS